MLCIRPFECAVPSFVSVLSDDLIVTVVCGHLRVRQLSSSVYLRSFVYGRKGRYALVSGTDKSGIYDQKKKGGADFSKLRKWTKGTNIFEKEYLFVPIHDK